VTPPAPNEPPDILLHASTTSRALLVASAGLLTLALLPAGRATAQKMPRLGPPEGRRVGDLAIDFKAKDLDGHEHRLRDLRGHKVVHLVFWATWCVPCLEEIPHLREAYSKYGEQGLEILGVTMPMDQTAESVRGFVRKQKLQYPILWDEGQAIMSRYHVDAIPQNFLIGRDGIIRYAGGGLPDDYDTLVRKALSQPTPSQAAAPQAASR
jgi:peroxiredoxin